jgi:hypothetical protein
MMPATSKCSTGPRRWSSKLLGRPNKTVLSCHLASKTVDAIGVMGRSRFGTEGDELQRLLDRLHDAFSCPTAIIDKDGDVLTASGRQDICTKFHRAEPPRRANAPSRRADQRAQRPGRRDEGTLRP